MLFISFSDVCLGLAPEFYKDTSMPGTDGASFGYYGNNGKRYNASSEGNSYGPTFGTGDTIGLGVTNQGELYYTKNGSFLGSHVMILTS